MTRIFIAGILILFLAFVVGQIYVFWGKRTVAAEEYSQARAELKSLKDVQDEVESELEYLSHPENLEKELRARFNYRTWAEEFIILVPPTSSSNTSNTGTSTP